MIPVAPPSKAAPVAPHDNTAPFERVRWRWRNGIPTIGSTTVARDSLEGLRNFIQDREFACAMHLADSASLPQTTFLAAAAGVDPLERIASSLGGNDIEKVRAIHVELQRDSPSVRTLAAAKFGANRGSALAAETILGPWDTIDRLWQYGIARASVAGVSIGSLLQGFIEIFTLQRPIVTVAFADEQLAADELLGVMISLVETSPELLFVIGLTAQVMNQRVDEGSRSWALAREGRFEIPFGQTTTRHDSGGQRQLRNLLDRRSVLHTDEHHRAKSLAEGLLYDALQRRQATVDRFELNALLDVRFGPRDAEVDLLDRRLKVAVEVDGFYHFGDLNSWRRDRRKDVLLQHEGFLVIRTLADDVLNGVEEVVDTIAEACTRRRSRKES